MGCGGVIPLRKEAFAQFFVRFWWHFFRFLPILAVFRQNGITFSARSTTFVRMLMDFVDNSNNYKYIPFRCNHYFHITIIVPLIPEPGTLHKDIMEFLKKNLVIFSCHTQRPGDFRICMFHYYGQDWSKELISAHLLVPTSELSDTYQRRSGLLKTFMQRCGAREKKRRENTQHRWSGCNSKYLDTTYTFSGMFHHSKYNSRSYNMYFLVLEFFSVISNAPNSRTTFPHQKSLFLTLNV